ncbi:MAG TPA: DMT family transporter [Thermomicrobiales bacterium]|nr:DMT family transporter [Thermomicrobiales bacterium]
MAVPARATRHSPAVVGVALLYILLWSSSFIATKVVLRYSPPLTLLAARFLAAAGAMALLARLRGLTPPRDAGVWGRLALFGLCNAALPLAFNFEALRHLSAGTGAIIAATNPLLVALVAPFILGERLSWTRIAGLALGFGGVIAVMVVRLDAGIDTPTGIALSTLSVLSLVAATFLFKRLLPAEEPLVVNAVQLAAAGLVVAPLALLFERPGPVRLDVSFVAAFLYLVAVISVAASLLWFWLLARGEASVVSAYFFLTPIFGLGLAALLLGEPFTARDAAGLVAVMAGIFLIGRPARARET